MTEEKHDFYKPRRGSMLYVHKLWSYVDVNLSNVEHLAVNCFFTYVNSLMQKTDTNRRMNFFGELYKQVRTLWCKILSISASSQLISGISNLFKCAFVQAFCDVTLACDGGSIKCHKMVLAASSPYFHKLFMETSCDHPIVFLKVYNHCAYFKEFFSTIMLEILPGMFHCWK